MQQKAKLDRMTQFVSKQPKAGKGGVGGWEGPRVLVSTIRAVGTAIAAVTPAAAFRQLQAHT